MSSLRENIKSRLKEDKINFLLVQFVDLSGAAKVKMCPVEALDTLIDEGAGFAGAALGGFGQGPNSPDMMARVDLTTYTPLPWQPGIARFVGDLYVQGEPYPYCPRLTLKRALNQATEKIGFTLNVGLEPEHFLITRKPDGSIQPWDPANVDHLAKPCYDFKGISSAMGYLQEIVGYCNQLGWGAYQADHEDANGQYEVNFQYADALTTADRYTFFKMMTSQVAPKYGAVATHMPKPFADRTGSGAHMHYHIADRNGENLFASVEDNRGMGLSKLAYQFLGGILKHAPALCAILSPTVNCYKRLQVGEGLYSSRSGFTWTPAFVSYGGNNRTQMQRVCGPGHIEDRTVSAGCNPYLVFAAYLAAGLDGIEQDRDPGEPNHENLYELTPLAIRKRGMKTLPQTLHEALFELERDPVVLNSLGPIGDEFVDHKRREWIDYHRSVSGWEIENYLTRF
jgi:glutamine synthetase